MVDGAPVQVISSEQASCLPVIDLSGFVAPERAAQSMRLAVEEIRRPFDLARGPLVRLTLVRLEEEEHLLLVTMHHIVSDGWSMGVFFQELAESIRRLERQALAASSSPDSVRRFCHLAARGDAGVRGWSDGCPTGREVGICRSTSSCPPPRVPP